MQSPTLVVAEAWQPPQISPETTDPLLGCLLALTQRLGKSVSAETLLAGMPLENGRLTPELFVRAATRGGLSAKIAKRPLNTISDLVLPAVLLLDGGEACVLVRRSSPGNAMLILPEAGSGERETALDELGKRYSGYAILVSAAPNLDARSADSVTPDPRNWFWSIVLRSWPLYGEVTVASLLINIFALVMPLYTMNVYDRVVPNHGIETLWALSVGAMIVIGFDFMMRILRGYFIDIAGKRIDATLSSSIFERVLGLQMQSRPGSVGAFASSLQEFEGVREFLTSATITTLIDLPFVLLFIAALFWIGGPIGWVAVAAIPTILLVSLALQGPISRVVQANMRLASQRQASLIETLVGLETIKVMGAEGPAQRKWEQVIRGMGSLGLKSRLLSSVGVNFSSFAQQVANVAVVIFGVYLIMDDKLTMGALIACTILTGRALAPLSQLAALLTRYHQSRSALASIDKLMHLPVERPAGKDFVQRPKLQGGIEFKNVSFAYPGQESDALIDVSFNIKPGERVGLIGRVGSGKTTIEKLVLGLYPPKDGSILIDGAELRQIDPAALRRDIGYVPQDILLFYGSVRDNICLGAPYAEDAAILRAAEISGVAEFVNRLPNGFDLQVGERGEGLSGGQRQAIAIARAELLAPPLLMLDEPSSAMDSRSEELFKARLAANLGSRTLVVVTHRASLLTLVNRVIVMDQGRVIADGPKEQVLAALAGGKINVPSR
jgi:ATP-binding cassette, subfamily C, bacterial LapB